MTQNQTTLEQEMREILTEVYADGKLENDETKSVEQATQAILTAVDKCIPEKKRYADGEESRPFTNGKYLGFNTAIDEFRQLIRKDSK